ncbi:MAG: YesL family protein [Lachnospiraceae bacterium]|nr:YesL family protein [Lachnospiraceae bacterium]
MGRKLGGFLSNDSVFGQIMTRVYILVAANLMFVLCSLPIVTAGPALVALYHVMLRILRGESELSPVREFFKGFKDNFKQAIVCWLVYLLIMAVAVIDYRFLRGMTGAAVFFKYAVAVIAIVATIIMLFLAPVMAAFADTIPHLLRNAVFFAVKNPLRVIAIAVIFGTPVALTYLHVRYQPLYAFCWFFFGVSAVVMASSSLLIKDFEKYLPPRIPVTQEDDEFGGHKGGETPKSEKEILEEMKRLEM